MAKVGWGPLRALSRGPQTGQSVSRLDPSMGPIPLCTGRFPLAEGQRVQVVTQLHPSPLPSLQKGLSASSTPAITPSQTNCPPLLTAEVVVELEWGHVPLYYHITPW